MIMSSSDGGGQAVLRTSVNGRQQEMWQQEQDGSSVELGKKGSKCFLLRRIEPKELNIFRCITRYGDTDLQNKEEPFEKMLAEKLKAFINNDFILAKVIKRHNEHFVEKNIEESKEGLVIEDEEPKRNEMLVREIEAIDNAWRAGVVHFIGENEVIATKESGLGKKFLINYAYSFLKKNLRQSSDKVLDIPNKRKLKVGMTCEL